VKITISDIEGKVLRNIDGTRDAGLNRVQWDLRGDRPEPPPGFNPGQRGGGGGRFRFRQGPQIDPGTYVVKLSVGGKDLTTRVVVEEDIWFGK